MKKIIFILCLLCTITCFAEPEADTNATGDTVPNTVTPPNIEAVDINESWKVSPTTLHDEDAALRYTIDVNYPQIEGDHLSLHAKRFNQLMTDLVKHEMQQFKQYVANDMPHMQSLPEDLKHNGLRIDYDVDIVRPNEKVLISVRLFDEGFQAGRAHPYHVHEVLNFDLNTGRVLKLSELFKSNSNYLKVISQYSNKKLKEKLNDKWMIDDGTKPLAKNYDIWNLENDGLLITFDEYQVAPYVYGAQEVEIPYSELKTILSPKAPIYPCAINPDQCEGVKTKVEDKT